MAGVEYGLSRLACFLAVRAIAGGAASGAGLGKPDSGAKRVSHAVAIHDTDIAFRRMKTHRDTGQFRQDLAETGKLGQGRETFEIRLRVDVRHHWSYLRWSEMNDRTVRNV